MKMKGLLGLLLTFAAGTAMARGQAVPERAPLFSAPALTQHAPPDHAPAEHAPAGHAPAITEPSLPAFFLLKRTLPGPAQRCYAIRSYGFTAGDGRGGTPLQTSYSTCSAASEPLMKRAREFEAR